jgi:hypothetical protein
VALRAHDSAKVAEHAVVVKKTDRKPPTELP